MIKWVLFQINLKFQEIQNQVYLQDKLFQKICKLNKILEKYEKLKRIL